MSTQSYYYPLAVQVSPEDKLDALIRRTDGMDFQGTDCSLPMVWATQNKVTADAFIVLTDNETYSGSMHPVQVRAGPGLCGACMCMCLCAPVAPVCFKHKVQGLLLPGGSQPYLLRLISYQPSNVGQQC
jgi:hypothetical protein